MVVVVVREWCTVAASLMVHSCCLTGWCRAAASELELGELCGEIKLAHRERDQVECDG